MNLPFKKQLVIETAAWALLLLALLPILRSASKYQGWGGDYAGYLLEAKKIATGESLQTSNYLYNPNYTELAPPAYPVGFPLLMAPVYKAVGLDMGAYTKWMGFFWWLVGVGLFLLLKRFFTTSVSVVTALFFMYHPLFFFERNAVLSDYPFVVFLLFAVYFYIKPEGDRSLKNAALVGFLAGYAWLIRSIGVVVPLLIACHFLWENRKGLFSGGMKQGRWRYPAVLLAVAGLMQWLVHHWLFPLPETGSYWDQLQSSDWSGLVKRHLMEYAGVLLQYFQLSGDMWHIYRYKNTDLAVAMGGAMGLGVMVLGLLLVKKPHERLFVWVMLAYAGIILLWPAFQGLRFLLPVLPFLMYFLVKGLNNFDAGGVWRNRLKWALIPLLLYGEYDRMDRHIYTYSQNEDVGSPEWKDNQEAYRYVKDSLPADAVFGYHHPLIFALYAEKSVMRWPKSGTPQEMQADFDRFKVNYLLVNDWLTAIDEPLKNYLKENSTRLDTVWHNERNVLIKFK